MVICAQFINEMRYSVVRLYLHASGRGFNVDKYKYEAKEEKTRGGNH